MNIIEKLKEKWNKNTNPKNQFDEHSKEIEEVLNKNPEEVPKSKKIDEPLPIMDFSVSGISDPKYFRPENSFSFDVILGDSPEYSDFTKQSESEEKMIERIKSFIGKSEYLSMSKSEARDELDEGLDVALYEYDHRDYDITFAPEPEGTIVPTAIRIDLGGFGTVGYVPHDKIARVSEFLYGDLYNQIQIIDWHAYGGKNRYFDTDSRGNYIVALDKTPRRLHLEVTFGYKNLL